MCDKLEIFMPFSTSLKELNLRYQPGTLLAIPILYNEIFFTCYRDLVKCLDKNCTNFKKLSLKVDLYEEYFCESCAKNKVKKRLNYIIIDLRLSGNGNIKENEKGKVLKIIYLLFFSLVIKIQRLVVIKTVRS